MEVGELFETSYFTLELERLGIQTDAQVYSTNMVENEHEYRIYRVPNGFFNRVWNMLVD